MSTSQPGELSRILAENRKRLDELERSQIERRLSGERHLTSVANVGELAARRLGLDEDGQRDLERTLADIQGYKHVTDEERDQCKRVAIMTAQLKARNDAAEVPAPLAKVLEFRPRPA